MADTDKQFQSLMARVRGGSQQAVRDLLRAYRPYILRVVREHLDPRLRSKFDSIDFEQDVWKSFFTLSPERYTFECPADLTGFLIRIAQRRMIESDRQDVYSQKRDLSRERSLDDPDVEETKHLIAPGPTPSQVVTARDEVDSLPPAYQRLLTLLQDGYTHEEIACRLGVTERTIERMLRRFRLGKAS